MRRRQRRHAFASAAARGATGDWANFMRAILAGGTFNGTRILAQSSVDAMLAMTTPAENQLAYNTGAGSQMTHVTEIDPASITGYVLFTNEGLVDALVGPGSDLNRRIHEWLEQL